MIPNLRKTATYKHLYPSLSFLENTEMPSQESEEDCSLSPVDQTSQPETVGLRAELENKITGSIVVSESEISTLFDELPGRKDLDKDGISSQNIEGMGFDLPADILFDILSRLPVKTLIRFNRMQNTVCSY